MKIIEGIHETHFRYDGLDRRVGIVEKKNGVEQSKVTLIWDGTEIVQRRDSTGVAVARNYFDQGFEEGSNDYYYTKDHLGSIREVVASDGTTIEASMITPLGEKSARLLAVALNPTSFIRVIFTTLPVICT